MKSITKNIFWLGLFVVFLGLGRTEAKAQGTCGAYQGYNGTEFGCWLDPDNSNCEENYTRQLIEEDCSCECVYNGGTCSAIDYCWAGTCYCDAGANNCNEGYVTRIGTYPNCDCECVPIPVGGACSATHDCYSGTCYCDVGNETCAEGYIPNVTGTYPNCDCECVSGSCQATLENQFNLTTCLLDEAHNGCLPPSNPVPYFNPATTSCECYCLSPEVSGTCEAIAQLYASEWCIVSPINNSCNDGYQAEAYSYYQEDGISLDHCDCQCIPEDAINTINWQDLLFCGGNHNIISTAFGCIPVIPRLFTAEFVSRAVMMAGGIALLLTIFAGVMFMLSSGNPDRIATSARMFKSALFGLLMVAFSIFVLRLLGIHLLNIPGI